MRVLIADDEPALAEHLMQMLQRLDPNLSVCACVHDGRSALEALHAQRPDAAFIDIRMPAPNGLEVAAQAPSDCRIVFVTAYDQYAVPAFEHEAVDYLLKPVSTERLARTLGRLRERAAPSPEVLARLLGRLQNTPMPEDEFLRWIRAGVGERVRLVSVDEVLYCQARDKYTSVITPNREYVIRTPIKALVEALDP